MPPNVELPLEEELELELLRDEDLEDPLCGDSRLEIETLEEVCIDTSEWDFVGVPFCDRLPEEGFNMELPLSEDVEDTLRLPGEGEPTENFLLEDLREVPLEILVEVRLILPDEELPIEGELEVELSRYEELAENSLVEDGLEKAVRRSPKLEREFRLNPSVETDLETVD